MSNLLIWNQGSGRAAEIEAFRRALPPDSTSWIQLTRDLDLPTTIRDAASRGCDAVIAVGGDGTVNAVVNGLMQVEPGQRPPMAILPLGTANDFAGTLSIPDDPIAAMNLIRHDGKCPIDVIKISGEGFQRYYANVAAGGNCVRASEELTDEIKQRWGAFSYLRGAAGVLTDMFSYRVSVTVDNMAIENLSSWAILVANGKTNAGRIQVAPEASPADGLLDVILIRDGDVTDMLEIIAGNLTGNFLECDQIIFRQAKKLQLRSDPPMRFTLDGEVIDQEPVEFEVMSGAIKMFVGPEFIAAHTHFLHAAP